MRQYVPALESFFLSPDALGLWDKHVSFLLGNLGRAGIDSTATALRLLRREEYAKACLFDLRTEGRAPETLKALTETPVPSRFQPEKDLAIEEIRRRVQPVK